MTTGEEDAVLPAQSVEPRSVEGAAPPSPRDGDGDDPPGRSDVPAPAPVAPVAVHPEGLLIGDVHARLKEIPDGSIDCCICSPPYWNLRSYLPSDDLNKALEIGAEATPEEYIAGLVEVFRAVRRTGRCG